ncbi:MAG: hypothetical protein K2Y05_05030 [Hyphomicrobiaceae bacterium]|nr:hypothetical protein [Hyphomicrobiaceae bacterium]
METVRKPPTIVTIAVVGVDLILVIVLLSGVIGGFIASAKGKNAFLWFVLCALLPLVGHLILAFSSSNHEAVQVTKHMLASKVTDEVAAYDTAKWAALIKYDPDIASAADKARTLNPDLEKDLAEAYLALGDKSYLPSILAKLEVSAAEIELRKQEAMRTGAFSIKEGVAHGFRWRKLQNGDLEARIKGEWTKIPRLEFLQTVPSSDAY